MPYSADAEPWAVASALLRDCSAIIGRAIVFAYLCYEFEGLLRSLLTSEDDSNSDMDRRLC